LKTHKKGKYFIRPGYKCLYDSRLNVAYLSVIFILGKGGDINGRVFLRFSHLNLLKTKRNLLYIRNQSVPRSIYFPPRLWEPIS